MLGKRGPPYSALIYSVDASGFEQTDVNNSKIVRRSHICGFAYGACDFAAAVTEGGFWGVIEKPDYY